MKTLGYIFAILGTVALVSIFFGYTHQILSVVVCGLMAHALLSEDAHDGDERAESK